MVENEDICVSDSRINVSLVAQKHHGLLIKELDGVVIYELDGALAALLRIINIISEINCAHNIPLY